MAGTNHWVELPHRLPAGAHHLREFCTTQGIDIIRLGRTLPPAGHSRLPKVVRGELPARAAPIDDNTAFYTAASRSNARFIVPADRSEDRLLLEHMRRNNVPYVAVYDSPHLTLNEDDRYLFPELDAAPIIATTSPLARAKLRAWGIHPSKIVYVPPSNPSIAHSLAHQWARILGKPFRIDMPAQATRYYSPTVTSQRINFASDAAHAYRHRSESALWYEGEMRELYPNDTLEYVPFHYAHPDLDQALRSIVTKFSLRHIAEKRPLDRTDQHAVRTIDTLTSIGEEFKRTHPRQFVGMLAGGSHVGSYSAAESDADYMLVFQGTTPQQRNAIAAEFRKRVIQAGLKPCDAAGIGDVDELIRSIRDGNPDYIRFRHLFASLPLAGESHLKQARARVLDAFERAPHHLWSTAVAEHNSVLFADEGMIKAARRLVEKARKSRTHDFSSLPPFHQEAWTRTATLDAREKLRELQRHKIAAHGLTTIALARATLT